MFPFAFSESDSYLLKTNILRNTEHHRKAPPTRWWDCDGGKQGQFPK